MERKGLLEVFGEGAGFGVEEGAGLGIAVDHEDAERFGGGSGPGGGERHVGGGGCVRAAPEGWYTGIDADSAVWFS